jgi:hypothetical protein
VTIPYRFVPYRTRGSAAGPRNGGGAGSQQMPSHLHTDVEVERGVPGYSGTSARPSRPGAPRVEVPVLGLIAFLLVAWLVLIVVGAVVHGLFWLVVLGVVLFLATSAFGWVRRGAARR